MRKSNYLLIGWCVIIALLAWQLWFYGSHVSSTVIENIDLEPAAVLNVAFLAGLAALGLAVFQDRRFAALSAGVISVSFLILFGFTALNLLGVLLVFLLHFLAVKHIRSDMARTKLDLFHSLRIGTFRVVTCIFILVSFAAYQAPNIQNFKDDSSLPPVFANFFKRAAEYTAGDEIPVKNEHQKKAITDQIGQEAFRRFNLIIEPYLKYAPPVVAFALFLILMGLSWIFVWLGALIALGVFWILKKVKLIKIEIKETEAEVIQI